jgi:hypothetical protein
MLSQNTAKKVALVLGVASVASSISSVAVKAGPALQTLNNLTNTAEFTINNTYGQSFSVDGVMNAAVTPFAAGVTGDLANFTASTATLTTNFTGTGFGNYNPVTAISASVATPAGTAPLLLNATGVAGISLGGADSTQTIGASISSTLFGPSSLKATSSFTNQLINDLSAF